MLSIAIVQRKVISCNSANKSCLLQVVHKKAIAALTKFCDFFGIESHFQLNTVSTIRLCSPPSNIEQLTFLKPFPSEVITVFLKSPNETRTSTIKFGEDISEYTFQSGTSIEVHIYCCITSHWLIATEVKIYGNKKLDQGDFKINWRPLKGANMSSNAFCMHFEETVKQFIDLRDQSLWKAIELSEKPPIKSSWSKHNLKENYRFFLFFFCTIQTFPDISMVIVQARIQNESK